MQYDNRFNGVLSSNAKDTSDLIGPIKLDDAARDDLVALVIFEDSGRHSVFVHERRRDGKALKRKPVATGFIKRVRSNNAEAPVARGTLAGPFGHQPIVVWQIETAAGRRYQIKPDTMAETSGDAPDIP